MLKTTYDNERSTPMKNRFRAALLLAALCLSLFSGCASVNALQSKTMPEIAEPQPALADAVPDPTPAATPAATGPARNQSQYISKEEARNIALSDAGLSADEVTRLKVEFDFDDGVPEYEVDFHYGIYEYDYEIHAETGKIRSWHKDRDD